jgi:hypothetical protein
VGVFEPGEGFDLVFGEEGAVMPRTTRYYRNQMGTCLSVLILFPCTIISTGCDPAVKPGDFAKRVECEKLYDAAFLHFEQEQSIGRPGNVYQNAQATYGFYSPNRDTCIVRIVSTSPEPHKSAVWFYDSLENKVWLDFDDQDAGVTPRKMWDKAYQAEEELRK